MIIAFVLYSKKAGMFFGWLSVRFLRLILIRLKTLAASGRVSFALYSYSASFKNLFKFFSNFTEMGDSLSDSVVMLIGQNQGRQWVGQFAQYTARVQT